MEWKVCWAELNNQVQVSTLPRRQSGEPKILIPKVGEKLHRGLLHQ